MMEWVTSFCEDDSCFTAGEPEALCVSVFVFMCSTVNFLSRVVFSLDFLLMFHSVFMDSFTLVSDILRSLSCTVGVCVYPCICVCVCVFMDAILFTRSADLHRNRVTLSKTVCAVTAQFSALRSFSQTASDLMFPHGGASTITTVHTSRMQPVAARSLGINSRTKSTPGCLH